jgi:hypothetical protein
VLAFLAVWFGVNILFGAFSVAVRRTQLHER